LHTIKIINRQGKTNLKDSKIMKDYLLKYSSKEKSPTTLATSEGFIAKIQKKLNAIGNAILEINVAANIKEGPSVNP